MTSSAKLTAARAFFPELHKAIERVPSYSMGDPAISAARNTAIGGITALIEAKGGTVKFRDGVVSIRLFGLAASSTSGLMQACHNWKAQVTLKLMAEQMAALPGGAA